MRTHLGFCTIVLADKTYDVNLIRKLSLEGRRIQHPTRKQAAIARAQPRREILPKLKCSRRTATRYK